MKAEIIAVGSELLLGQIANTNAQFISQQLADIGIDVYHHVVVGDNGGRLGFALEEARKRSDIIILSGGLGPTKDDLTKETVAQFLGRELVYDDPSLEQILQFFANRKKPMTENNKKQALVIKGAHVFMNHHGLAPGMAVEQDGKIYILLPGPPKELYPMFRELAKPYLLQKQGIHSFIKSRVLCFFGIGESQLEHDLIDLIMNQSNPTLAPLAKDGEVTLRLSVKHNDVEEAEKLLDELEAEVINRVGKHLYGYGETSLYKELHQALSKKNQTVAAAESLTGGLFSEQMTALSGASNIFLGSIVSYATKVKRDVLHVDEAILSSVGAVSEETAKAMAEEARKLCSADWGVSFTGVAGPDKQEGKDVGTVYIGISQAGEEPVAYSLHLSGTREDIRVRTAKYGCYYLLKQLKKVE